MMRTATDSIVKGWLRDDEDDDDTDGCYAGRGIARCSEHDEIAHIRATLEQLVTVCSEATGSLCIRLQLS